MMLCKFENPMACPKFNGVACLCDQATGAAQKALESAWDAEAQKQFRLTDEEYVLSLDRSNGEDEDYHEPDDQRTFRLGYEVDSQYEGIRPEVIEMTPFDPEFGEPGRQPMFRYRFTKEKKTSAPKARGI